MAAAAEAARSPRLQRDRPARLCPWQPGRGGSRSGSRPTTGSRSESELDPEPSWFRSRTGGGDRCAERGAASAFQRVAAITTSFFFFSFFLLPPAPTSASASASRQQQRTNANINADADEDDRRRRDRGVPQSHMRHDRTGLCRRLPAPRPDAKGPRHSPPPGHCRGQRPAPLAGGRARQDGGVSPAAPGSPTVSPRSPATTH